MVRIAANAHEHPTVARLYGEEMIDYGDPGHLGIDKLEESSDGLFLFRIAMTLCQRRSLPYTAESRLENLFQTLKAHLRPKA